MMESITVDYIGRYVTVKFSYTPRLVLVMQNTPAAQYNRNKIRWELPPNDITVKWITDFHIMWPGIKITKTEKLLKFIKVRHGNIDALIKCRASIKIPLASVDDRNYKLKPWAHQFEALRFMVRRKQIGKPYAALFYEMGLGKTKIVIDFSEIIKVEKTLVVIPKTLCYMWTKEIKKNCATKKVITLDITVGTATQRISSIKKIFDNSLLKSYKKFVLINYDALRNKTILKALMAYSYDIVTLDESTYIKNYKAKRTKAIIKLGEAGDFKILMTGTPVTNYYLDLFSQLKFLNDEILGIPTLTAYKATYAITNLVDFKRNQKKKARVIVGWKNVDDLMNKVRLHSLIAILDDCFDIPKAMPPIIRSINLADSKYKKIRDAYNAMRDKFIVELKSQEITASNVLTRCLRLQQITSGFLTNAEKELLVIDKPPKIEVLLNIIEELGSKEKVIIAARFHYDIDKIKEALAPIGKIVEISGRVKGKERSVAIEAFDKDSETRFLVGTPRTFGYGLTFIETRYIVWYSSSFSYEERKQTNARIRRPGQKRRPCYIDIICENSVDELILTVLEKKRALLKYVMENGANIENLLPKL